MPSFIEFLRNANPRVNKTISFTQMKNGMNDGYNPLNDYDTERAKGTATSVLNAIVVLNKGLSYYQVS